MILAAPRQVTLIYGSRREFVPTIAFGPTPRQTALDADTLDAVAREIHDAVDQGRPFGGIIPIGLHGRAVWLDQAELLDKWLTRPLHPALIVAPFANSAFQYEQLRGFIDGTAPEVAKRTGAAVVVTAMCDLAVTNPAVPAANIPLYVRAEAGNGLSITAANGETRSFVYRAGKMLPSQYLNELNKVGVLSNG